MIVGQKMFKNVVTIDRREKVVTAFEQMRKHRIRHLPVMDGERLVGIISDRDIKLALIPETSPRTGERFYYLLETTTIEEIMTTSPITVTPQTPLEEAAKLIYRYKIGSLPVVEEGKLVGIITETDILEVFIEMMGFIKASSRLDVILGEKPEAFEEVSKIIQQAGGKIISVGISPYSKEVANRIYHFRLEPIDLEPVTARIQEAGYKVLASYTT
ncbi:MAG: CBS domain-containing protein [Nitrospinota bacterium]|nr:MAG: CBS domain-containing protein [Nitrospinota bacterium]